jgi:hypothetical protein
MLFLIQCRHLHLDRLRPLFGGVCRLFDVGGLYASTVDHEAVFATDGLDGGKKPDSRSKSEYKFRVLDLRHLGSWLTLAPVSANHF